MLSKLYWHGVTRLRIFLWFRALVAILIWTTGFGIPTTTRGDPEATTLEQQILNNRQQQDLIREQRGYQQRLQNTTPEDQPRINQRLRQQRFHQKQLQHRQTQDRKFLLQQGRAQPDINRPNQRLNESLRSRRAQESKRLQLKLQRRTWRYR